MLHELTPAELRANSAVPTSTSTAKHSSASSSQPPAPTKADAVNQAQELDTQREARVQSGESASTSTAGAADSAQHPSFGSHPGIQSAQTSQNGIAGSGSGRPLRAGLSKGSCISSNQIEGSWKVFDMAAVPIDETDPDTGGPLAPIGEQWRRCC